MNLPPPPPLPPPAPQMMKPVTTGAQMNTFTNNNDAKKLCYERKTISREEAIKQIEQLALMELDTMSRDSFAESTDEALGMLVIMTPILQPILQNGPVCGLIALVEAAQIMGISLAPDFILKEAIGLGMTKNGEMFSVEAMKQLVNQYLEKNANIFETTDLDKIFQVFLMKCLRGSPILIPKVHKVLKAGVGLTNFRYDADRNHSPSLRLGHAAHWAVVHGVAIPISISKLKELQVEIGLHSGKAIVVLEPEKLSSLMLTQIADISSQESIYVIAHQGKSIRAGMWKYTDLISSNQNLKEISPKLTINADEYVLGNIETGLCSKLIFLEK